MNVYIDQMKTYLDEYPPEYGQGNIQSLVDLLYWSYTQTNPVDSEKIRQTICAICDRLQSLPFSEMDFLTSQVNCLCAQTEEAAFQEGVRVGARLMLELREWEKEPERTKDPLR